MNVAAAGLTVTPSLMYFDIKSGQILPITAANNFDSHFSSWLRVPLMKRIWRKWRICLLVMSAYHAGSCWLWCCVKNCVAFGQCFFTSFDQSLQGTVYFKVLKLQSRINLILTYGNRFCFLVKPVRAINFKYFVWLFSMHPCILVSGEDQTRHKA